MPYTLFRQFVGQLNPTNDCQMSAPRMIQYAHIEVQILVFKPGTNPPMLTNHFISDHLTFSQKISIVADPRFLQLADRVPVLRTAGGKPSTWFPPGNSQSRTHFGKEMDFRLIYSKFEIFDFRALFRQILVQLIWMNDCQT